MRKNRLIALIGTLTMAAAGLAAVGAGVSSKKADSVSAATVSANCTKLVVVDHAGWCFRSIELTGFGFDDGYSSTDLEYFIKDFYQNDKSGSWDNQGTQIAYNWYSTGCNLCAGGSGDTYTYYLPTWLSYCDIKIKNNDNTVDMNYLNNLRHKASKNGQYGTVFSGSGTNKTVTFDGWSYSDVGTVVFETSINSTQATTNFKSSTVTKNYVDTNDTVIKTATSSSVCAYLKYAVPTIETISGYTSPSGWKKGSSSGSAYSSAELVKDGFNLYAVYSLQATTYSLNFNSNGGTGSMTSVTPTAASSYKIPANTFTRNGYSFAGWATSSSGAKLYNNEDTIPANTYSVGANVTLYAKWAEVDTYTVYLTEYDDWKSSGQYIYAYYSDTEKITGDWPGTKLTNLTYINNLDQKIYIFDLPADISHIILNNGNNGIGNQSATYETPIDDGKGYYIDSNDDWKLKTWNVYHDVIITYQSNYPSGEGPASKTETAYRNEKHTLTESAFTAPTGFIFDGWNTSADGTGDSYSVGSVYTTDSTTSVTLYAQWIEEVENGYYLRIESPSSSVDRVKMELKQGSSTEYVVSKSLNIDDVFRIVRYENSKIATSHGYNELKSGAGSAKGTQIVNDNATGYMKAAKDAEFTIYYESNTSGDFGIWIGEVLDTHVYTLRNLTSSPSTDYTLNLNESTGEYVTTSPISFAANDVLGVYDSVNGGEPQLMQNMNAKNVANNNCYNSEGGTKIVCTMTSSTVYVDINQRTIFCSGFEVNNYYMVLTHSDSTISYIKLKLNENPLDQNYREYLTEGSQSFLNGDIISFVDTTDGDGKDNAVAFDVATVDEASLSSNFVTSGTKIACNANVDSFAYLKLGVGEKAGINMVYFSNVDLENAIVFANEFLTEMGRICQKSQETGWNDQIGKSWGTEATNFANIEDASGKDLLKKANASSPYEKLRNFAEMYDYIYSKYSAELKTYLKVDDADFALRFKEGGGGVNSYGSHSNLIGINNISTSTWIIATVTIVGVAAVGVFFIYKKRKEN